MGGGYFMPPCAAGARLLCNHGYSVGRRINPSTNSTIPAIAKGTAAYTATAPVETPLASSAGDGFSDAATSLKARIIENTAKPVHPIASPERCHGRTQ